MRTVKRWLSYTLLLAMVCCDGFIPITAAGSEKNENIVITADEIRAMNAHKMADVLNHVPGITAGDSSVGIHGSYKVKVFVDGRPINDPTSGYGGINWELVAPADVERIEILRGKGGMRYGQDASGGVILITTKKVRKLTGNIKVYGGNHQTGYGSAGVQVTSGGWSMGANGSYETTDGYKINNDKEHYQMGAKLGYTFDDRKRVFFLADFIEDERGSSGLPDYPTPFYRKSAQNTNLALNADFNNITSATFYNQGSNHNTDSSRELDQKLRITEWGEDVAATRANHWGELNIGCGYQAGLATGTTFDDQSENTVSAFAAQSFKWPSKPLTFNFGLRANFNSAFDDAVNPEIKVAYNKDLWRVTAVFSRSNNTPSFHQRFSRSSSTLPNPDLTMETADNYTIAFFLEPYDSLTFSMSVFHNRLSDRITYVTGDDGMGRYQNFGLVTYSGADLAASWQIHETVKLKSGYTYLKAKDEDTGLWLPAKAKHSVTLDLYWKPCQPISMVLANKYVSKAYLNKNNTKTVPEYSLTDFRAEYVLKRFSLFGEIENVFDKTYYYCDGLLAPPMTWIIGVSWRI
ncbi:MAG: TonB-dependent receptor [Proteobacteria bacterium]|nr:TonB-dependent receptor [Pseudomonadota bacterium]